MKEKDLKMANEIEYNITRLRHFLSAANFILKNQQNNFGVCLNTGNWSMISNIDFYPEFTEKATKALVKVTGEMLKKEEEKLRKL